MKDFVHDKFVYIAAEGDPGGHGGQVDLMNLFKEENAKYAFATWSARHPEAEQDFKAKELLDEG